MRLDARLFSILITALTASTLAGCEQKTSEADAEPAPAAASSTAPAPGGTAQSAAGLNFELPAGWQAEVPSSSMRIAQATIPGTDGPGQLSVFFFGTGGGGGVDANLQRWISQMDLAEGSAPPEAQILEREGLKITMIDLSGTLKASRIGTFPQTDMPGYRMMGAVVEGEGGPWFFRAVGPEGTLAAERDGFIAMLEGARPE